jgi:hypothetical protein
MADAGEGMVALAAAVMLPGILMAIIGSYLPPHRVELVGCRTFRDLAYRLAGQQPRRRIHQSA